MYLFCSKCQTQFPATSRCPRCSSRLLSPVEAAESLSTTVDLPPKPLQTTMMGRVFVGSILALGLHLAFREWGAALGLFDESASAIGYLAGYFFRVVAAMAGGFFAGAGRVRAFSSGAMVGLLSGVGWLIVDSYPDLRLDPSNIGLMILIVTVAGCCALLGGRIWPAIVEMPEVESPRRSSLLKLVVNGKSPVLTRPTRWGRILVSSLAVLGAVLAADGGRVMLKKLPSGLLHLGGPSAVPMVDFQIAFLGIALASLIAGAGSGAGLRHGAIAGLISAITVCSAFTQQEPDSFPALEFLLDKLQARGTATQSVLSLGACVAATVTLAGYVGGQLFPPLNKKRRRRTDF